MGAEFLALNDGNQLSHVGHHVTFTFVGEIESVRARLISGVGKLGYLVVEEDPIIARHTKAKHSSSSILDFIDTLTIRLKTLSPNSTRAIFEYKYYDVYGRGARVVLTQHAKAIAAVAAAHNQSLACASCGTEATDESRFCRRCGAPMLNAPAELEVLRVTAESHAGYLCVLQGTIGFMLAFTTLLLITAIKGSAFLTSALVFTLIFAVPSFILMMFGIRRLRRTFNLTQGEEPVLLMSSRPSLSSQAANDSLPEFVEGSVTEGTTELLESKSQPSHSETTRRDNSVV